jgi:hypothetical protein
MRGEELKHDSGRDGFVVVVIVEGFDVVRMDVGSGVLVVDVLLFVSFGSVLFKCAENHKHPI